MRRLILLHTPKRQIFYQRQASSDASRPDKPRSGIGRGVVDNMRNNQGRAGISSSH